MTDKQTSRSDNNAHSLRDVTQQTLITIYYATHPDRDEVNITASQRGSYITAHDVQREKERPGSYGYQSAFPAFQLGLYCATLVCLHV